MPMRTEAEIRHAIAQLVDSTSALSPMAVEKVIVGFQIDAMRWVLGDDQTPFGKVIAALDAVDARHGRTVG
jgi:hypothetical protein